MKKLSLALALAATAGCATFDRVGEYGATFADARNFSTAFEMQLSVHPRDDTLLIYSRGSAISTAPGPVIVRRVADEFVGDTGCAIGEVREIGLRYFEAPIACPSDFDFRAAIAAQREQLRQGAPLQR